MGDNRRRRLDRETRGLLENPDVEVLFSAASIWEIAIKTGLRREDFPAGPQEIADAAQQMGFMELPIHSSAAARVADLRCTIVIRSTHPGGAGDGGARAPLHG